MALNIEKLQAHIAAVKKSNGKKTSTQTNSRQRDLIWKPEEGIQIVRIVPNQYQLDDPFIVLKFYYDFVGEDGKNKTYISPSNFNNPDPVIELSDRLKKSGDKKLWYRGKTLEPKTRYYLPIIIRGKEKEGIKFWGFGVQIFEQLAAAMTEPDYGDITDLNSGCDIQVTFVPAEKSNKTDPRSGKKFPETSIFIKPKPRPVIGNENPDAKEILEKITTQQPKLIENWECPSYETLSKVLENSLKKSEAGKEASQSDATPSTQAVVEVDDNVVLPTEEQIAAATAPVVNVSPSAAKAADNTTKAAPADDMTAVFNELFNETK